MPVTNTRDKDVVYTYLPSIDMRPSRKIHDWYVLPPGEEATFTPRLRNSFVNLWVSDDYPWTYFHVQNSTNLEFVKCMCIDIREDIRITDDGIQKAVKRKNASL